MTTTIVQFTAMVAIALGCSWLAQIWRFEGQQFIHQMEQDGGTGKQSLVSDGTRSHDESVAFSESEGEKKAAHILAEANAKAAEIVATGVFNKEALTNPDRIVNAFIADAFQATRIARASLQTRMSREETSREDIDAIRTVIRYLDRAQQFEEAEQAMGIKATIQSAGCSSLEQRLAEKRVSREKWLGKL